MPIITLDTVKIAEQRYELTQVVSIGYYNESEIVKVIDAPDRMVAAMTNLGLACRWFIDNNVRSGVKRVALQRDNANKGELLGGEHNDLFNAVNNLHNHLFGNIHQYRQDRLKYEAFYGNYVKYLDKIVEYLIEWQIVVTLVDYKEDLINAYS